MFGLVIALVVTGVVAYLAMHDKTVVAGILGGGTRASVCAVFVVGRVLKPVTGNAETDDKSYSGETATPGSSQQP